LVHKRGLARLPPPLGLNFIKWWGCCCQWWWRFWWGLLGSAGLERLQMGLGINVRWALEGKHTNKSADGALPVSLTFHFDFFFSLI